MVSFYRTILCLILLEKQAAEAAEKAGDIDLLVNCAGIAINEPFLEAKVENFDKTMRVNVRQVFSILVRYLVYLHNELYHKLLLKAWLREELEELL
jgi:short-subunit dehydrogenase